jgi:ADP-heptose:LPS heptosyltransferase
MEHKIVLICHRGALGDFILTWPALLLFRKHFPGHRLFGIGRPDYMKLAVRLGILDGFHDSESASLLGFFGEGILPCEVRRPEKAFLWLKDAERTAALLHSNSKFEAIPMPPFPSGYGNVSEFHLKGMIEYLRTGDPPDPIRLIPEYTFPEKNILLIHPGSGSLKKNFPPIFYLDIAKFAEENYGTAVRFILGPAELERGAASSFPSKSVISPEDTSSLADVLGGVRLFIGNDSGVGHLSAFLGTPSMILYRHTDPATWGAVGRKVTYLKGFGEDPAECLSELQLKVTGFYTP